MPGQPVDCNTIRINYSDNTSHRESICTEVFNQSLSNHAYNLTALEGGNPCHLSKSHIPIRRIRMWHSRCWMTTLPFVCHSLSIRDFCGSHMIYCIRRDVTRRKNGRTRVKRGVSYRLPYHYNLTPNIGSKDFSPLQRAMH